MSGFNIIQLNVEKINKDDYINCMSTIDDSLIESHTDYVDDDVNDDERLKSVKYSVAPFATVNRARRTLTFKKRETVIAYYLNVIESGRYRMVWLRPEDARRHRRLHQRRHPQGDAHRCDHEGTLLVD